MGQWVRKGKLISFLSTQGKYQVVEYSEITSTTAEKKKKDGSLLFDASNICIHYFKREFLDDICNKHLDDLPHHIAK